MVHVKQISINNKNKASSKPGKLKTGKDASDNDTEEEDSDFEDPDEIEVPGGGKDLDTIIKVTGNPTKPNPGPSPGNTLFSTTCNLSILINNFKGLRRISQCFFGFRYKLTKTKNCRASKLRWANKKCGSNDGR